MSERAVEPLSDAELAELVESVLRLGRNPEHWVDADRAIIELQALRAAVRALLDRDWYHDHDWDSLEARTRLRALLPAYQEGERAGAAPPGYEYVERFLIAYETGERPATDCTLILDRIREAAVAQARADIVAVWNSVMWGWDEAGDQSHFCDHEDWHRLRNAILGLAAAGERA